MNQYGFTSQAEKMKYFRRMQKVKIAGWMILAAWSGWTLAGIHLAYLGL